MTKPGRKRIPSRARSKLELTLWAEAERQGLSYAKLSVLTGFAVGTLRNAYHGQCSLKVWQAEIVAQALGLMLRASPRDASERNQND